MNLLYISHGQGPDYLCDMLFHGLRSLVGDNVVDYHRSWYMYRTDTPANAKKKLYGRGFTLYGLLDDDAKVDRKDIIKKLKHRYFDYVIYGSAWRSLELMREVSETYPSPHIIFVDGEDEPHVRGDLLGKGQYFKREFILNDPRVTPIQFAIPAEKLRKKVLTKMQLQATVLPGESRTYVFHDEQEYHDDYAKSYFGVTRKRAGWDCLRHYEIMANGCIPWFIDLAQCPRRTLLSLPKKELFDWSARIERRQMDGAEDACEWFRRFAEENLSTLSLAKRFLDQIREPSGVVTIGNTGASQEGIKDIKMDFIDAKFAELRFCPGDINEHLETLRRLASQCRHVTEFGTRTGVSTWALLAGRPQRLITIDIRECPIEEISRESQRANINFQFIVGNTADEALEIEETDFLFIDTLHTYRQLSTELHLHGHKARHFLAFHDTVAFGKIGEMTKDEPGLIPAITEYMYENRRWRIIEDYKNNNGLMVLASM